MKQYQKYLLSVFAFALSTTSTQAGWLDDIKSKVDNVDKGVNTAKDIYNKTLATDNKQQNTSQTQPAQQQTEPAKISKSGANSLEYITGHAEMFAVTPTIVEIGKPHVLSVLIKIAPGTLVQSDRGLSLPCNTFYSDDAQLIKQAQLHPANGKTLKLYNVQTTKMSTQCRFDRYEPIEEKSANQTASKSKDKAYTDDMVVLIKAAQEEKDKTEFTSLIKSLGHELEIKHTILSDQKSRCAIEFGDKGDYRKFHGVIKVKPATSIPGESAKSAVDKVITQFNLTPVESQIKGTIVTFTYGNQEGRLESDISCGTALCAVKFIMTKVR